jgi:1-acyl-sn-glycerol-3-phosphate acyltransferase
MKESSWRMRAGLYPIGKWYRSLTIEGKEHVPTGKPVVFAASHVSDLDMPLAASVLVKDFNIGISYISALLEHPVQKKIFGLTRMVLGKNNFFPIDYSMEGTGWKAKPFNANNFTAMSEAMKVRAMHMLVAAHIPSYDFVLPSKGGLGAIWLAHEAHAPIVPMAIDIQLPIGDKKGAIETLVQQPLSRPAATIRFGKPLVFDRIDLSTMDLPKKIMLRDQSRQIMEVLAGLLPAEKRGGWNQKILRK